MNRTGGWDDSVAEESDGGILDCTGLSLAELREADHPVLRSVLAHLRVRVLSSEEVLAGFNDSVA